MKRKIIDVVIHDPIKVVSDQHDCHWTTLTDIHFTVRYSDGTDKCCVIPKGFVCDGASISPYLSWLVPKRKMFTAGVVHDWTYRQGTGFTREESDKLFSMVARTRKALGWRCGLGRLALRLFGGTAYHKKSVSEGLKEFH